MIFEYLARFFHSCFNSAMNSDQGAFVYVIGGFTGLSIICLVVALIRKIKSFSFIGG